MRLEESGYDAEGEAEADNPIEKAGKDTGKGAYNLILVTMTDGQTETDKEGGVVAQVLANESPDVVESGLVPRLLRNEVQNLRHHARNELGAVPRIATAKEYYGLDGLVLDGQLARLEAVAGETVACEGMLVIFRYIRTIDEHEVFLESSILLRGEGGKLFHIVLD
mgnify:CR=1 FL=1